MTSASAGSNGNGNGGRGAPSATTVLSPTLASPSSAGAPPRPGRRRPGPADLSLNQMMEQLTLFGDLDASSSSAAAAASSTSAGRSGRSGSIGPGAGGAGGGAITGHGAGAGAGAGVGAMGAVGGEEDGNLEQLGPMIKSLDESGRQDAFLRLLASFVRDKEAEIEGVCNDNYQDFVSAVDKLLKVRQGTVSLRHRIGELNEDIQQGGKTLAAKKRDLLDARAVARNVDEAIDTLQACLRVLDIANRVSSQIEARRYYPALRSLEELESIHLQAVLQFDFAKLMLDSIPLTRLQVKEAVTREMKEWLYEVRNVSHTVGRMALDGMESRQRRWKRKQDAEPRLKLAQVNSPIELVLNERIEYNFMDNEHVRIDFRPLYQAIHIYDVLDAREELQNNYQADRRAQADLLLSKGLSFHPSNPTFPVLLEEVVGFFLVESHVLRSTPDGFRSEQEVDDLWDTMCERVVEIVSNGLRAGADLEVFVSTKSAIVTFIQTLEGYSFSVEKLNALLLTLFERYSQLLLNSILEDLKQGKREEDHQPMVIDSPEDLAKVLSVSWLKPGEADRLKTQAFPLTLPFSNLYPLVCMEVRDFVKKYYAFSEGFAEKHRDIDDILRKSLDDLLTKQISEAMSKGLATMSNLSQLVQTVLNAEYFGLACDEFEGLLTALRAPHRGGRVHLTATASFGETLVAARSRIHAVVAAKLDQFFGIAEYDWCPPPRSRAAAKPERSLYLQDMVDWLNTIMASVLVGLPKETWTHVYAEAWAHVAAEMKVMMLSKDEPAISPDGLSAFEVDIDFLAETARSAGATPEESKLYADKFGELTQASPRNSSFLPFLSDGSSHGLFFLLMVHVALQTLAIVRLNAATEYASQASIRQSRYPAVQPANLATVLEKLIFYGLQVSGSPEEAETAGVRQTEREAVLRLMRTK